MRNLLASFEEFIREFAEVYKPEEGVLVGRRDGLLVAIRHSSDEETEGRMRSYMNVERPSGLDLPKSVQSVGYVREEFYSWNRFEDFLRFFPKSYREIIGKLIDERMYEEVEYPEGRFYLGIYYDKERDKNVFELDMVLEINSEDIYEMEFVCWVERLE